MHASDCDCVKNCGCDCDDERAEQNETSRNDVLHGTSQYGFFTKRSWEVLRGSERFCILFCSLGRFREVCAVGESSKTNF